MKDAIIASGRGSVAPAGMAATMAQLASDEAFDLARAVFLSNVGPIERP
ncbi:hypothetical protein [Jiangella endophytica]|nr:hypothetical protein [Jiangella endophytica]